MKNIRSLSILNLLILLVLGCGKYGSEAIEDESMLTGKWQLTEAFISAGGPQYWVDVEDG